MKKGKGLDSLLQEARIAVEFRNGVLLPHPSKCVPFGAVFGTPDQWALAACHNIHIRVPEQVVQRMKIESPETVLKALCLSTLENMAPVSHQDIKELPEAVKEVMRTRGNRSLVSSEWLRKAWREWLPIRYSRLLALLMEAPNRWARAQSTLPPVTGSMSDAEVRRVQTGLIDRLALESLDELVMSKGMWLGPDIRQQLAEGLQE